MINGCWILTNAISALIKIIILVFPYILLIIWIMLIFQMLETNISLLVSIGRIILDCTLDIMNTKLWRFQIPLFFSGESCFSFVLADNFLVGLELQTLFLGVAAPVWVQTFCVAELLWVFSVHVWFRAWPMIWCRDPLFGSFLSGFPHFFSIHHLLASLLSFPRTAGLGSFSCMSLLHKPLCGLHLAPL